MAGTKTSSDKVRAPRNRTLVLSQQDRAQFATELLMAPTHELGSWPDSRIGVGDCFQWLSKLPRGEVDLLFLDPPYNLDKSFNGRLFKRRGHADYTAWLADVLDLCMPLLKKTASVYICGDWLSSHSVFEAAHTRLKIRNRITWEREKGRGATHNWKNSSEDIWFCTVSDDYTFKVDRVKLRRRVIAPYTNPDGSPKDWLRSDAGDFRDTHPSNLWTDVTVPFWSMPENTDHPTQKSEKLLAKVILASSNEGDLVLDPFVGSGTACVVAKKLKRRFFGVEIEQEYCLMAAKRLALADRDSSIQGVSSGVFWERNAISGKQEPRRSASVDDLFDVPVPSQERAR